MIYLTAVVAGLLFAYLITAIVNVSGHTDGFRYGSPQQIRRSPRQVRIGSVLTPPGASGTPGKHAPTNGEPSVPIFLSVRFPFHDSK